MNLRKGAARVALTALIGALALCVATPRRAAACATCAAGDPTLTQVGVGIPYAGRVRASLSAGLSSHDEGEGASRSSIQDHRLILGVAASPAPWLTLSLFAPLVHRDVHHASLARDETWGIGNLDVRARLVLFRDRGFAPSHLLSLQVGLSIPTLTPLHDDDGELVALHAQPGTGAFVPLVGLSYSFFADPISIHATSAAEVPAEGFGGVVDAPSIRTSVVGQWQAVDWGALMLGLDTRVDLATGAQQSGGVVLFVSPGLMVSPVEDVLSWLIVRVPVVQHFDEPRAEGLVVEIGVAVDVS